MRVETEHGSFGGAVIAARDGATQNPGVKYRVERTNENGTSGPGLGTEQARYHMSGGKLTAWVR